MFWNSKRQTAAITPRILFFILFQLALLQPGSLLFADVQTDKLQQAQDQYHKGELNKTIELIRQYLKESAPDKTQKTAAYALLAKTFMAQDKRDSAKEVVRKIIESDPAYQPTIEQEKPSYVNLVSEVRREFKAAKASVPQNRAFKINWLWVGAGTTAAAIIGTVVLSKDSGGDNSKALPKPPPFNN